MVTQLASAADQEVLMLVPVMHLLLQHLEYPEHLEKKIVEVVEEVELSIPALLVPVVPAS